MTDTHVHLNADALWPDAASLVERAAAAGLGAFLVPGWDRASSRRAVHLADSLPGVFAIVGIHPGSCHTLDDSAMAQLRDWSAHPRVVAIGEIGVDTYRGETNLAEQESACRRQFELAGETGLPVVLHCRAVEDDPGPVDNLLRWLIAHQMADRAVWHCYGGNAEQADRIVASGGAFGFDGPLTYKKNNALRTIAASVPRDRLLLETDSPWLPPEPLRGKHPNVPERLPLIARALASATGETLAEIGRLTDANARRVFPKMGNTNPVPFGTI